jgi:hypothetical protein
MILSCIKVMMNDCLLVTGGSGISLNVLLLCLVYYAVLGCLESSCLVLFCPKVWCFVFSVLTFSCVVLCRLVLWCVVLSSLVLS